MDSLHVIHTRALSALLRRRASHPTAVKKITTTAPNDNQNPAAITARGSISSSTRKARLSSVSAAPIRSIHKACNQGDIKLRCRYQVIDAAAPESLPLLGRCGTLVANSKCGQHTRVVLSGKAARVRARRRSRAAYTR